MTSNLYIGQKCPWTRQLEPSNNLSIKNIEASRPENQQWSIKLNKSHKWRLFRQALKELIMLEYIFDGLLVLNILLFFFYTWIGSLTIKKPQLINQAWTSIMSCRTIGKPSNTSLVFPTRSTSWRCITMRTKRKQRTYKVALWRLMKSRSNLDEKKMR